MKKTLLSLLALAGFAYASAQPAATPVWSESVSGVDKAEDIYRYAPVALTTAGDVYATGKFTQTLVIGNSFLEPIANSAYLAKYSADGTAQWAVSLAGAATITAITADEDGNVYIAGVLADEVIFGSTSGETATLTGRKGDDGSWETSLSSSFIAKYDKDGVLKGTKSFVPSANPALVETFMYYPFDGDIYFKINHLQVDKGQLYASALYTGLTSADGTDFQGTGMNLWDMIIGDLRTAGVFSLSAETLAVTGKLVELKSTAAITTDVQHEASAVNFTVDNGTVYAACIGYGAVTLTTPAGSTDYSFISENSEETTYNHIVTAINDTQVNTKVFEQPALETISKSTLGGMQIYGDALYIGGTYNEKLTFAPAVTSTNGTDLYVARLNKETLDVTAAYTSGFDEEETNKNQEIFTSLLVAKGTVYLNGYHEVTATHEITAPLAYTIDVQGMHRMEGDALVTGAAGNENILVFAGIGEQYKSTLNCYATVDAIGGPAQEISATVSLQGETIFLSEPSDIVVYNLQGRAVRTATAATRMSISGLPRGCYIARIGSNNNMQAIKFVKSR